MLLKFVLNNFFLNLSQVWAKLLLGFFIGFMNYLTAPQLKTLYLLQKLKAYAIQYLTM